MTGSTVSLPPPNMGMVMRLDNAVVTRAITRPKGERHSGAVYDSNGALVRQSQRFPQAARKWCDPPLLAEALADGRQVERWLKRAIYLGHAFTHFGHLLVETLPNLCWAREVDAEVPLLFHPFDARRRNVFTDIQYGAASRQLLGIAPERIVMADIDLAVDELLLPPRACNVREGPLYDYRPVYRAMREAALREAPVAAEPVARRVYLSRRLLKRDARIANEAAVESRMVELGFAILYPERLGLEEQVRAVAEADLVVGVDGSALHLAAFMRAGAQMLVLRTKRRRNISHVNELMGVTTAFLDATPPSEESSFKTPTIDVDRLVAAIVASSSGRNKG